MNLNNKIAVLTGASSGLGSAIASALVKENTKVYGIGRNENSLYNLQKDLGPLFYPVVLDITNQEKLKDWVSSTFSAENIPDILINNAGSGSFGNIDELPESEWLTMINTNLNGMYFITSNLIPLLKKNPTTTHIINIGSILGNTGRAGGSAYCTTKYGVRGFSEALFKELRADNIKVTCINPGSIDTGFFKSSGINSHENMLQPSNLANTIIHVLETPDNMLINELTVRPLDPRKPA